MKKLRRLRLQAAMGADPPQQLPAWQRKVRGHPLLNQQRYGNYPGVLCLVHAATKASDMGSKAVR